MSPKSLVQAWVDPFNRADSEYTVNSSLLAVPVYERFGFRRVSPTVEQSGIAFVPMRLAFGGDEDLD